MNIYIDFLYFTLSFVIIYLPMILTEPNEYLNLVMSGQGEVQPCAIGINIYTIINNTSDEDFFIELLPKECCIENTGLQDCDSLNIVGECAEILPKGTPHKFQLIAPLLNPVERRGYCSFYIDSRPVDTKIKPMRDTIKVKFDTTINKNPQLKEIKPCKVIDEDPMNNCKPVNCELYYNGVKPFFDQRTKRCVKSKSCYENQVYDLEANDCKNCNPITERDIHFIKSLKQHGRPHKDVIIIKSMRVPKKKFPKNKIEPDDDSQSDESGDDTDMEDQSTDFIQKAIDNDKSHKAITIPKTTKIPKPTKTLHAKAKIDYVCYYEKIMRYVKANLYTLLVLGCIIILQCLLLVAMVYYVNASSCCNKKKVIRKFFNYRQDASVTTPLIGTSNIETETTECNYVTESSNLDKQIKCYKACQKTQNNDTKMSMSDDILAKYLNRRDWNTKLKTEMGPASPKPDKETNQTEATEIVEVNEVVNKREHKTRERKVKEIDDVPCYKSEREIQSHDYYTTTNTGFPVDKHHNMQLKKTASMSTEKGAQASFSNDSVDDLLSEKGILFFEENMSKYSISTSSPMGSMVTESSSKTSKNNILKHFLSFLSRKSKLAVNSEPNRSKDKLEFLHLHISNESIQSSSDSNIKRKSKKFFKESRSTF